MVHIKKKVCSFLKVSMFLKHQKEKKQVVRGNFIIFNQCKDKRKMK